MSQEIKDLVKEYKEPDLTLFMSNPETKAVEIPFVKKKWNWFTENKINFL